MNTPDCSCLPALTAANAASLRAALGRANGSPVLHTDAVTAVAGEHPTGQRAVITDGSAAHDTVAVLDGFFGPDAPPYVVEDHWARDWRRAGLRPHDTLAIMACERPSRSPPPHGLDVAEVSDAAELAAFVRILLDVFVPPERRSGRLSAVATAAVLEIVGLRLLLGRHRGVPVATACAWEHAGIVGVYWIGVLPRHRGRGYGRAMTATALPPGAQGVLTATTAGARAYRQIGWRTVGSNGRWIRDPG